MPRSRSSKAGAILEFFRSGDAGEVKVLYQLVQDVVRERFAATTPKRAVAKKATPQRKSTGLKAAAQPEEAVNAHAND